MTIRVRIVRDFFAPETAELREVEWSASLTPRELVPSEWDPEHAQVFVDGDPLPRETLDWPLVDGEEVTCVLVPGDAVSIGSAIAEVVYYAIAIYGAYSAARSARAAQDIADGLRKPQDDSSAVYGWSGPLAVYAGEGLPLPLIYGAPRVGGIAIAGYAEVIYGIDGVPRTYINLLFAMGSGPIKSIGGIEVDADFLTGSQLPAGMLINDNTAENFSEITAHVRLGTLDQEVIPGFESVPTKYDVDLLIDQTLNTSSDDAVTDFSLAASFDMPADDLADRFVATLFFPEGLYRINDDGQIKPEEVLIQIRYQELDGGGTPIGDAAIIPSPTEGIVVKAAVASPFSVDIPGTFIDPSQYIAQTYTNAMEFEGANSDRGKVVWPLHNVTSWATGNAIDALTYVGFLRLDAIGATDDNIPIWCAADWNESYSSLRVEGIMVYARSLTATEREVRVAVGEGVGSGDGWVEVAGGVLDADVSAAGAQRQAMIAVTWERAAVGSQNRLRLFVDGGLVAEKITSVEMISTSYANMLWLARPNQETNTWGGFPPIVTFDEQRVYDVALTPEQVAAIHNGGIWSEGSVEEPGLVLGFRMDGFYVAPGSDKRSAPYYPPSTDSESTFVQMDLVPNTSAYATSSGFVLTADSGSAVLRGAYTVDVQRLDKVKDSSIAHDRVRFDSLTTFLDSELTYPGVALLGVRALVNDQLEAGIPQISVPVEGVKDCPVWDGIDAENPGFDKGYSSNPAWCLAHMLIDAEQGAGHLYDAKRIDWQSFNAWADYCDELVYDQRGRWGGAYTVDPITLEYVEDGFGGGDHAYRVTVAGSLPQHFVAGKSVRLHTLEDPLPGGDWPDGFLEIRLVVLVTDGFELWFTWPSGVAAPASTSVEDATAVMQGVEPRLAISLVLGDRGSAFMDARARMAKIGRASLVPMGEDTHVVVDAPRQPVAVFNASNIKIDTFKMSSLSLADAFNSAVAEFQDQDANFTRAVVKRDHASLEDPTSTVSVRRRTFDMRGVSNRSQIIRELQLLLNAVQTQRLYVEFETVLDGLFLEPGDVIVVSHPLPAWSHGGRCAEDSSDAEGFVVDAPFVLGQGNMLEHTRDLEDPVWEVSGSTPPAVSSTKVVGPDGTTVDGWRVTFATGTSNVLRQRVPHLGVGTDYIGSVQIRVESGDADQVVLELTSPTESIDSVTPTLTSDYQRVTAAGTSTKPTSTDALVSWRLRLLDTAPGPVVVDIAWPRLVRAAVDDGLDGVGSEGTDAIPTAYVAITNPTAGHSVGFAELVIKAGAVPAGATLELAAALDFVPHREWPWVLGHTATGGKLFSIESVQASQQFRHRIRAIEYSDAIYPDPEDFETLDPPTPTSELAVQSLAGSVLPGAPQHLDVRESAERDSETGALTKAIVATWDPDPATAHAVVRTHVWIREGSGPWEHAAALPGAQRAWRMTATDRPAGETYTVAIQPEGRTGMRPPVDRCRQAKVTTRAVFPMPPSITGARLLLTGIEATYEVDLPSRGQGAVVEVLRGGTFLGAPVGRIPVGGTSLGPTDDWCVLPAAADGRGSPPIYFRLAMPHGGRGDFYKLEAEPSLAGWPDALVEDSWEDGPWGTATSPWTEPPILTDLEVVAAWKARRPGELRFDSGSSALTGTYVSTVYDLGRPRNVHVSCGVFGSQDPPYTVGDVTVLESLRERSLTCEGYLDPNHPRFGKVQLALEWSTSATSADPGTDWQPFRCGTAYIRSARFRIRLTRPDDTWGAIITRAGVSIRPTPPANPDDFDGGGFV